MIVSYLCGRRLCVRGEGGESLAHPGCSLSRRPQNRQGSHEQVFSAARVQSEARTEHIEKKKRLRRKGMHAWLEPRKKIHPVRKGSIRRRIVFGTESWCTFFFFTNFTKKRHTQVVPVTFSGIGQHSAFENCRDAHRLRAFLHSS